MLGMILSAVTSRLAGPIAIAGCAVLALMLVGAKMETGRVRGDLKAQVAESKRLDTALRTCRGNVTTLEESLASQSAAVAAAKADGERRVAAATKAAVEARTARAASDRLVARLTTIKAAGTCDAREAASRALVEGLSR